MTVRLAIFDCDGTLVDSGANIGTAMAVCFDEAGLAAPDRAKVRRLVGLSLFEAMQQLHPDGDDDAHRGLTDRYKSCFQRLRAEGRVEEPLFEGVPEALDALAADGWTMAIATGKSDRGLRLALEATAIARHFVSLQTADGHPSKPHPSMIEAALAEAGADAADAVMIGDTGYDIAMAHAAGVRAIGVAWGYHEADELLAAGAETVARHPRDLPRLCAEVRA